MRPLQLKISYCIHLNVFRSINRIPTHLTSLEKAALFELVKKTSGSTFVEIGSYLGASSCCIAAGINSSEKDGPLYCVDTWQNDTMTEGHRDTYEEFMNNTKNYADLIIPLRGKSIEIANTFNHTVDFLFIDGDHTYEGVKRDVEAWFPKLNPGALVIFHDIGWAEGVQKIVKEFVTPHACEEGRLPNLYWAWLK